MPRKARIDFPGALHHIIVRGIERCRIFKDDQDRYAFVARLGQVLESSETGCYAWALLPNHFHLLLRTGRQPIASVMNRLLTGHAISFNRRHRRHGHLFQNRYKSILCQEDSYLLELVRYIHLNPLRANLVGNISQLASYPFSGHGTLMGGNEYSWQDTDAVLGYFGKERRTAQNGYHAFVAQGIGQGRRGDLIGGGLVRSAGGWMAVKDMRKAGEHGKSDERILGDSDFVEEVLSAHSESFERSSRLQSQGMDVDAVAERVAHLLAMEVEEVWQPGKYKRLVTARSVLCFWVVRELGETMSSLAQRLGISVVAVSKSVTRGEQIVREQGYNLLGS